MWATMSKFTGNLRISSGKKRDTPVHPAMVKETIEQRLPLCKGLMSSYYSHNGHETGTNQALPLKSDKHSFACY